MTNRLIRVIHIHATKQASYTREEDTTRTQRLLQDGWRVDQDQLQQYDLIKLYNVHIRRDLRGSAELERLAESWASHHGNRVLAGIRVLDISSPPSEPIINYCAPLPRCLTFLLPNLRAVDFSYTSMCTYILIVLSRSCPLLEHIQWNHCNNEGTTTLKTTTYCLDAGGDQMEDILNLHTIEMDDCVFKFDWHDKQEDMMDLKNRPGHHLFYKCCANFRRVSIRNMDMHIHTIETDDDGTRHSVYSQERIPQDGLIKFVRNSPSLEWLRSNLSQENTKMLRAERPGVEFVN